MAGASKAPPDLKRNYFGWGIETATQGIALSESSNTLALPDIAVKPWRVESCLS
jgi:hypothetical protein